MSTDDIHNMELNKLAALQAAQASTAEAAAHLAEAGRWNQKMVAALEAAGRHPGSLAGSAFADRCTAAVTAGLAGYVRPAVRPDFPSGKSWAEVEGEATAPMLAKLEAAA